MPRSAPAPALALVLVLVLVLVLALGPTSRQRGNAVDQRKRPHLFTSWRMIRGGAGVRVADDVLLASARVDRRTKTGTASQWELDMQTAFCWYRQPGPELKPPAGSSTSWS